MSIYPDDQEEIQALIAEFLVRHLALGDTEGPQPATELARTGSAPSRSPVPGAGLVVAGVGAVLLARRRRAGLAERARPTRHA